MTKRIYSKSYEARLLAEATEFVGNEREATLMLEYGLLRLRPRCGAHARSTGKPCRAPGNGSGGRCKLHGGLSTGPRTHEGLRRLSDAARRRWRAKRTARSVAHRPRLIEPGDTTGLPDPQLLDHYAGLLSLNEFVEAHYGGYPEALLPLPELVDVLRQHLEQLGARPSHP